MVYVMVAQLGSLGMQKVGMKVVELVDEMVVSWVAMRAVEKAVY